MVTGGAGFIGSHIVNEYIIAGHDVVIIDEAKPPPTIHAPNSAAIPPTI